MRVAPSGSTNARQLAVSTSLFLFNSWDRRPAVQATTQCTSSTDSHSIEGIRFKVYPDERLLRNPEGWNTYRVASFLLKWSIHPCWLHGGRPKFKMLQPRTSHGWSFWFLGLKQLPAGARASSPRDMLLAAGRRNDPVSSSLQKSIAKRFIARNAGFPARGSLPLYY